jgi:hypothetical protein
MFEPKQGHIPGYTGHQQTNEKPDELSFNKQPEHRIPGYGGYVPGVQSENVFGQTYGKHTLASASGTFHRGIDHPVDQKFQTTSASSMLDHSKNSHPTAAQIVGVHREEDCYTKPIPPSVIKAFHGCHVDASEVEANAQQFDQEECA